MESVLTIADDDDGNVNVGHMDFIDLVPQLMSTGPKGMMMLLGRDVGLTKDLLRDILQAIIGARQPGYSRV